MDENVTGLGVDLIDEQRVEISVTENQITGVDQAGNQVAFDVQGWVGDDVTPLSIEEDCDATVTGRATGLWFEPDGQSIKVIEGPEVKGLSGQVDDSGFGRIGDQYHFPRGVPLDLPSGAYQFRVQSSLLAFIRVNGAPTLSWSANEGEAKLAFPHPTTVTLGFRSAVNSPRERITVPSTPAGVATALGHLSAGIRTVGPERSFPSMRNHPPTIALGQSVQIPDTVREKTVDGGVEIVVPPTFETILPLAPLAYYLGATVRIESGPPTLRVPSESFEQELPPPPAFQYQVGALLRRVFMLDCLVRNAGPWSSELDELAAVEASSATLDIGEYYELSAPERLVEYLDLNFDAITDDLPAWRHWVYIDPDDIESVVPALSSIAADMGMVFTPDAMEASRLTTVTGTHIDELEAGIAGRIGIDESSSAPSYPVSRMAYENRYASIGRSDQTTVTIVTTATDAQTSKRAQWLHAHYRQRMGNDGTVKRVAASTATKLASTIGTPTDILHIIGETVSDGIVCEDRVLSADSLSKNQSTLVILDQGTDPCLESGVAVGRQLVQCGSVSALVVGDDYPLPENVPTIQSEDPSYSSLFPSVASLNATGLLLEGASTQMAAHVVTYLSPEASITAVGDATYRLAEKGRPLILVELSDKEPGEFRGRLRSLFVSPGAVVWTYQLDDERAMLGGAPNDFPVTPEYIREHLANHEPVLYDGELFWPEETRYLLSPLA